MTSPAEPVLIIHNIPRSPAESRWSESDASVLDEVATVSTALSALGVRCRSVGLNKLGDLPGILSRSPERVVFNLVEEFPDQPLDAGLVPALCHAHGKASTGSDTPCILITGDKAKSKALLESVGLPCPGGVVVPVGESVPFDRLPGGAWFVKPSCTDASEGIFASSVIRGDRDALEAAVAGIHEQFRQPALVEQYIDGREFNVSLLQRGNEVQVLPVAEIDFSAFGPDRPRIVDYAAKWLTDSFEYQNTPRIVPAVLTPEQTELIQQCALRAWQMTGCCDYARVDFRMDADGRPYILEINANPDISPDAGFMATLTAAGVTHQEFVGVVLKNAVDRADELWPVPPISPQAVIRRKVRIRRSELRDRDIILNFVKATEFFQLNELEIAREVLDESLAKGHDGHYQSFVAEEHDQAAGWVCFGQTPCTVGTYDIYWLVVAPRTHRRGLGASLMAHAEELIRERGGRIAVVETAGRKSYEPTRRFYEKIGYVESARLSSFYAPDDDKVIYTKKLAGA